MAREASRQVSSLRYWFRRKYNLAPTDPRYLEMTDEGILLERELDLAYEGKSLKTCSTCGYQTHMETCPECITSDGSAKELFADEVADDAFTRMENGEEIDLEAVLRGEEFEPVKLTTKEGAE